MQKPPKHSSKPSGGNAGCRVAAGEAEAAICIWGAWGKVGNRGKSSNDGIEEEIPICLTAGHTLVCYS